MIQILRGLLFDNLGLKLTALLMAVLVYLHVYTDRPSHMMFSFPIQITGLDSTLALSGPVPASVVAELRGTGKQLIRLRLGEPVLKVSLAGVARGRFERQMTAEDLPISAGEGIQVERMVGPRTLELQIDRRMLRELPVAARVQGTPAEGLTSGDVLIEPRMMKVIGPETAVSKMDSVVLRTIHIDGRRDTVRAQIGAQSLPDWCFTLPATVSVRVPVHRRAGR